MIGRRGFLRTLAAAAAGFALDPDLALWVPGKVRVFDMYTGPSVQVIDGILKENYMDLIAEQLNRPTFLLFSSFKTRDMYVDLVAADRRFIDVPIAAPKFEDTYAALERRTV